MKFATRVNSFLTEYGEIAKAIETIGSIPSLDYIDLNYPEHFAGTSAEEMRGLLEKNNLKLNAINLRFRNEFLKGVFTNSDEALRKQAVDICIEAEKMAKALNGEQLIIWLSFDGYDYPFQVDYAKAWKNIADCLKQVCAQTTIPVSIEYKPYEERIHTFMDGYASTLLMVQETGCDNLGVTIDISHMLMKKENPAMAAAILLEKNKLFMVHLNDAEGSTDDGLMVGSIHPFKILELFYYLKKYHYDAPVYFDTFPKRERSIEETATNIAICQKLDHLIDKTGLDAIEKLVNSGDSTKVMRWLTDCLAD